MLAGATANACALVYDREALDYVNRSYWALARARGALHSVLADAKVLLPYRVAHVDVLSLKARNPVDRESRANVPAGVVAPEKAVATPEVHLRLAESLERRRRRKAPSTAVRNAKPTRDALDIEFLAVHGARRENCRRAVWHSRKRHRRETAVGRLLNGLGRGKKRDSLDRLATRCRGIELEFRVGVGEWNC